jgi:hypothetical protein
MKVWISKIATGIGSALAILAPVGRCPVCLSTVTGVGGSAGLGLLSFEPWFLPLIVVFLLVGFWRAISSARAHRRWGAVWTTAVGAGLLIIGRWGSEAFLVWTGAGVLAAALLLDLYWKRKLPAARLIQISRMR